MHIHSSQVRYAQDGTITVLGCTGGTPKKKAMRRNWLLEALRFCGTFFAVFAFLFTVLNAGSFWQLARSQFVSHEQEQAALQAVVGERHSLTVYPPSLPTAGMPMFNITPPDNRLVVPKIGKNIPLVEVSADALKRQDWDTFEKDIQHALRFGVVRYPGTAQPGEIGNVFITGHSSYYPWDWGNYKDVFALLPTLEVGEEYALYYEGKLYRYRITEKFEVSPSDVSVLEQPHDSYVSTLMTCTPIGTTLKRMILRAQEIDARTGEFIKVKDEVRVAPQVDWGAKLAV